MSEVQKFRKRPVEVEVMGPTTGANAAQIATWAHKSMPLASFFGWYVVKENETFELVSPAKFEALYESAPVPAPRLEWRDRSLETPGHAEWVSGRWRIYDNGHRVMLCLSERPGYDDAEIVVVDDTTVPAAKSLAEKLNALLSPPVGTQE